MWFKIVLLNETSVSLVHLIKCGNVNSDSDALLIFFQ